VPDVTLVKLKVKQQKGALQAGKCKCSSWCWFSQLCPQHCVRLSRALAASSVGTCMDEAECMLACMVARYTLACCLCRTEHLLPIASMWSTCAFAQPYLTCLYCFSGGLPQHTTICY
jgi:hypothetical protein